jgi:hypothetical protein
MERYNRTVRYDWLVHHLFDCVDQVQNYATQWLWTYNHERPNRALGDITPVHKLAMAAIPSLTKKTHTSCTQLRLTRFYEFQTQ